MVFFRDDNILVISPGSQTTLVNTGLSESLTPAKIEIPTKVYKHATIENQFSSKGDDESLAVYPMENGKIVNVAAFNYLIKLIYRHAQKSMGSGIHIGVILLSSFRWSRLQIETITQYAFETLNIPGFTIVPNALGAAFAHNISDALVIDVGKDKTEITPVNDYVVVEHAQRVIDCGGDDINKSLSKALPNLNQQQINDLKKSNIYEVLNESDTKNSWFALNTQENSSKEEEGVIDIAEIVGSGRTREFLDERERQKQGASGGDKQKQQEIPNKDREYNTFVDSKGSTINVGKERFHGTEELVHAIVESVGDVLKKIEQVSRRQDCWDNVVIVGRGSSVKGFKEALISALQEHYIILRSNTYSEVPSTLNTGHNTPNGASTPMMSQYQQQQQQQQQQHNLGHGQVPTSIKMARMAEYFPEWKGHGWEDAGFLGGQIAAKSIFGGQVENGFLSRNEYNQVGPSAVWDI